MHCLLSAQKRWEQPTFTYSPTDKDHEYKLICSHALITGNLFPQSIVKKNFACDKVETHLRKQSNDNAVSGEGNS